MAADSPDRPVFDPADGDLPGRADDAPSDDRTEIQPRPSSLTPTAATPTPATPTEAHQGRRQAAAVVADDDTADRPRRIGAYEILDVLGEGGMGTVYLAQQVEPLERQVALKLIRASGRPSAERVRRFRTEGQALARMSHPSIAQVFEAGTSSLGEPFIAMEHVAGDTVTVYADRRRLDLADRLMLFARVCDGIQHAHEKAVVHRDVKPSNVLVAEVDGKAAPKIIDFGIAKTLDVADEEGGATATRLWIGTPAYLSPEAIRGRDAGADIDTRADIYSLGVLLFELLVGEQPFGTGSSLTVLQRVVDQDTPRPSAFLHGLAVRRRAKLARRRRLDVRAHERSLARDLDWLVLRAMAKKRQDRYASAAELAADVRRFLRHEPILAGPPSTLYRARKFIRRHLASVVAAAGVASALVFGFALRSQEARRANFQAARASQQAEASRQVSDFLVRLFEGADPSGTGSGGLSALDLLDRGAVRIDAELRDQPLVRARVLGTIGNAFIELGRLDRAEPLLREAVSTQESSAAAEPLAMAESLSGLGTVLVRGGLYDESEASFERARAALDAAASVEHGEIGESELRVFESRILTGLASVENGRGNTSAAEPLLRQALALRDAHEPNGAGVAAILNNLANLCYDERRFDEAEALHLRAIAIKEERLGPAHFHLAQSLNNLANVYLEQGDNARAEPLHRRALAIKRRALPADHLEIGVSLHNLGDLASDREEWQDAAELYAEAADVFARALPNDHPFHGYSGVGLGKAHHRLGHLEEAETWFHRAYVLRADLPTDNIYWREVVDSYGALLRDLGREIDAAALEARTLPRSPK